MTPAGMPTTIANSIALSVELERRRKVLRRASARPAASRRSTGPRSPCATAPRYSASCTNHGWSRPERGAQVRDLFGARMLAQAQRDRIARDRVHEHEAHDGDRDQHQHQPHQPVDEKTQHRARQTRSAESENFAACAYRYSRSHGPHALRSPLQQRGEARRRLELAEQHVEARRLALEERHQVLAVAQPAVERALARRARSAGAASRARPARSSATAAAASRPVIAAS